MEVRILIAKETLERICWGTQHFSSLLESDHEPFSRRVESEGQGTLKDSRKFFIFLIWRIWS